MHEKITVLDGIIWKTRKLWEKAGNDMIKRDQAITTIAAMLALISSDYLRMEYVKLVSKEVGFSRKNLENKVRNNNESDGGIPDDERLFALPDGIDPAFVSEWGFYELREGKGRTGYWFDLGREKRALEVSNFLVKPLFHLRSPIKEFNKRMIEIDNGYEAKTIEIQSGKLIGVDSLNGELALEGNYLFTGTKLHLGRIYNYWGDKFPTCYELTNLGWQKEGFWAYSDRVYNGELLPYNEHGVVVHKSIHYYSPGANKKRSKNRENMNKFDADHQMKYIPSEIDFEQWAKMVADVYPEHYLSAIPVVCMALNRDLVLEFSNNFPLLYCYGEKRSGKSEFLLSIMNFFIHDGKMYNVNSGTDASFFTFVGRYTNCVVGLNEFDDKDIRPEWFQAIKGFFDIEGRKRNTDKYKMEEQPINCMAAIGGQYLSVRDDNSITTRSLLCHFMPKEHDQAGMQRFQKLVDIQKRGLNGILPELIQKRYETLEGGKLKEMYDAELKDLREVARQREWRWEDRVGRNYALLITFGKWAAENWNMPYKESALKEYAMARMNDVVNIMHTTDVLMEWFTIIANLADQGRIIQGWHYKVKVASGLSVMKNGKEIMLGEDAPRRILVMRIEYCHAEYMKEAGRVAKTTMNKTSVVNYFKNRDYFLGTRDGEWFTHKDDFTKKEKRSNSSVYVFDYDVLEKMGIHMDIDPDAQAREHNGVEVKQGQSAQTEFFGTVPMGEDPF